MEAEERLAYRIDRISRKVKRTVTDQERQELSCLDIDLILKKRHGIDMETYWFFSGPPATKGSNKVLSH